MSALRVKTVEEAMAVAKEMCRRHPELVRTAGTAHTARDVALKIFLQEVACNAEELSSIASSPRRDRSTPRAPAEAATPSPAKTHHSDPMTPAQVLASSSPRAEGSALPNCNYCNEPETRYCKNTGRRHETPQQRSVRLWKHIYRQLQVASNFISTARLEKKNTCVEEFAVELNLDDF